MCLSADISPATNFQEYKEINKNLKIKQYGKLQPIQSIWWNYIQTKKIGKCRLRGWWLNIDDDIYFTGLRITSHDNSMQSVQNDTYIAAKL